MKKAIAVLLSVCMIFGLVSCQSKEPAGSPASSAAVSAST